MTAVVWKRVVVFSRWKLINYNKFNLLNINQKYLCTNPSKCHITYSNTNRMRFGLQSVWIFFFCTKKNHILFKWYFLVHFYAHIFMVLDANKRTRSIYWFRNCIVFIFTQNNCFFFFLLRHLLPLIPAFFYEHLSKHYITVIIELRSESFFEYDDCNDWFPSW